MPLYGATVIIIKYTSHCMNSVFHCEVSFTWMLSVSIRSARMSLSFGLTNIRVNVALWNCRLCMLRMLDGFFRSCRKRNTQHKVKPKTNKYN